MKKQLIYLLMLAFLPLLAPATSYDTIVKKAGGHDIVIVRSYGEEVIAVPENLTGIKFTAAEIMKMRAGGTVKKSKDKELSLQSIFPVLGGEMVTTEYRMDLNPVDMDQDKIVAGQPQTAPENKFSLLLFIAWQLGPALIILLLWIWNGRRRLPRKRLAWFTLVFLTGIAASIIVSRYLSGQANEIRHLLASLGIGFITGLAGFIAIGTKRFFPVVFGLVAGVFAAMFTALPNYTPIIWQYLIFIAAVCVIAIIIREIVAAKWPKKISDDATPSA